MTRRITPILALCVLIAFVSLPLTPLCLAQESERRAGEMTDKTVTQKDQTGTDPRGFAPKFMPYYRYTRLKNDLKIQDMTLFGMFAFTPRFAMTYEWAIAKYLDYSDVDAFQQGIQGGSGGSGEGGAGGLPPAGFPPGFLDPDGDSIGMGDLGLRFFYKPEALEWGYEESKLTGSLLLGAEGLFPTATDKVLGSESFVLSPMLVFVHDTPTFGFVALMNFYDVTVFKSADRDKVSRYRGRWFFMQPLSKPGPWYGGIYLLPELQPIYDFEEDHFSFWIGPEVGKILAPGKIVYLKPGWGIDPDSQDREFTFELGWRWFF